MGGSTLDAETQAKILRQVEFYFSDSNLPGDKFLLKVIEDAPDGLVSLPLICSFSRMRSHLGLKEHGPDTVPPETTEAVAEVLRKSTTLRLSEDGSKVGRVEKLKAATEVQAEVDRRSLAICPFPWNVTLDEVENFFKEHSKVNSVRLPRLAGAKCFSGFSVVEFTSEEEAERVKGLKLSFQGVELKSVSKKAFEEIQVINSEKTAKQSNGKGRHDSGRVEDDEDDYPKGTVVSLTLTRKGGVEAAADTSDEISKKADGGGGEAGTETAVDTESQVSREDIKEVLKKFGKVNFVDFSRGDKAGFVRFELPEEAQQARAAAVLAPDGGFLIKEHILTLNPVEGEAEKEYWKKLREGQGKRRENAGRGGFNDHRGRGGRGGGKFGGKGGRGGGRDGGKRDGSRGNKHKRFDDNEDGGERKAARTD